MYQTWTHEERGQVEKTLAKIAAEELGVETLEERNRDRLDFYDCAVWEIKSALEKAYEAGRKAK